MKPEPQLFLSDARGVYIPRDFATSVKRDCVSGVSEEDWATLEAGPDNEWYWEAWTDVLDQAVLTDPVSGVKYTVYQDGDCWLIPEGMVWNDQNEFFAWEEEVD
jgi:hypothetical protein